MKLKLSAEAFYKRGLTRKDLSIFNTTHSSGIVRLRVTTQFRLFMRKSLESHYETPKRTAYQ